ncbi:MAG: efflux RND transporter periplasmic adaptor subunit [Verrucomicrobia bacterium]|nr:efflux RND transporter periplasmic adaptor subunit [Verrucomicrobiota bacterium]MBU1909886.1 efflux RND transporter periplasmic adaptor subunit [Verrucomicrobiota bacterium]
MKKRFAIVIGLLIAGLISLRIYQKVTRRMGGTSARQGQGGAVAVIVQPVRQDTIRDVRVFTGTVFPKTQFLVAPKVAGRLEKLLANIGAEVRNGDLIASLDNQEYKQQVEQARAELDVAKANVNDSQSSLEIAARELERARELRKQQVASVAEMDRVEALYKAAQAKHEIALAQIKQQEAVLKATEIRLSYTQIRAAWENGNGPRLVGERFVDEGAMLPANEPIVSIIDIDTVIAAIFVIERDYPHIEVGQSAEITTDAFPLKTFAGKIVRKAPLLKEASRQARVEIEVANPERLLVPGMFVRAEVRFAARDNAIVVPASAVVRRNEQRGVFLADTTTMKARFVPVTLGIVNADRAEIVNPPLEGPVVTMGQHLLEDGSAIIIPPSEPGADRLASPKPAGDRREGGSQP